ncbi:MAG: hypothetical protein IJT43_09125 [Stomatobaculum sp.]|nr:hypothetical protein [Stomatobaculum sp.]
MNNNKLTRTDYFIVLATAVFTGLLASAFLGFMQAGFQYPYAYNGGDDYSLLSQTKQLIQERWLWSTDRLGAPYGQNLLDYPSVLLQNTEYLSIKFWSLWIKDPVVIVNIQLLLTFVFCSITAYYVLRKLGTGRFLSVCGSLLFAFAPYIYGRAVTHYCLTACYFVPLSVYLCYTAYFREDCLQFRTLFKNWKENFLLLLFCLCIVNNGIGYYPFFTCFLLCVTAVCRWFETGDFKKALTSLKFIAIIVIMTLTALIPAFLYAAENGKNDITSRNLAGVEVYGLKITQLFIPLYSHGNEFLGTLISKYNSSMPLINENTTSYLGMIAGIGFVLQMLCFFGLRLNKETEKRIFLGCRLSLATVLFMTVGGFISLLATVLQTTSLRGFNRMSIFIMFISIAVLCFEGDLLLTKIQKPLIKKAIALFIIVLTLFGVFEQSPDILRNPAGLEANGIRWAEDEYYIGKIEASLQPGDMIFQLPYLPYPEGGGRNQLPTYRLLNGYLHSDTLKWSFGAVKGRDVDQWIQSVSQMNGEEMVRTLIAAGFKGIYVDRSGMTDEEFQKLHKQLTAIPGMKGFVSKDTFLLFYNLYPVIEMNPDLQAAVTGSSSEK